MTITIGSLFTGAGMLDASVRHAIGGDVVWHCEHEPATAKNPTPSQAAARLLAHHYPGVPNLGDITHVEWALVPRVDVLTGGFPCTDVSSAGKRAGLRPGTRSGLWSHMANAIGALRPGLVVIENVRGLLSADAHCDLEPCPWCVGNTKGRPMRALGCVLGDLADLGYDALWCGLRAADVRAPHRRFRVFICARPAPDTDRVGPVRGGSARGRRSGPSNDGAPAPDTDGLGRGTQGWHHGVRPAGLVTGAAPDTESQGLERPGPEPARSGPQRGHRAAPDPAGQRRGEGRPEPAGQLRGPDAALRGDRPDDAPAADTAGEGRGPLQPEHVRVHGGEAIRAGQAEPRRRDSAPADTSGRGHQNEPGRGDGQTQHGRAVPGPGDRADAGHPPQGVHLPGGDARLMDWGPYEPAVRRWELTLGRHAPEPTVTGKRGGQQLSPSFVEWMQGWPEGWVTGVPGLSRNDMLKILGNGVVPQQGAAAVAYLLTHWAAA